MDIVPLGKAGSDLFWLSENVIIHDQLKTIKKVIVAYQSNLNSPNKARVQLQGLSGRYLILIADAHA
jgi:hypothetical protein